MPDLTKNLRCARNQLSLKRMSFDCTLLVSWDQINRVRLQRLRPPTRHFTEQPCDQAVVRNGAFFVSEGLLRMISVRGKVFLFTGLLRMTYQSIKTVQ